MKCEFNIHSGRRLQNYCRNCNRAYLKEHYRANRQYYIDKGRRNRDKGKARAHQRLLEYLATHPCVDCGEADPVVLQFDHVRGAKEANVGDLLNNGYPWERILREIEKCDVRCSNCHWRRTAEQFGWYAFFARVDLGG